MRDATWAWFQDVARTRLMPGGRIVLTMTRWHEDDLAGRILNSRGASDWYVLRLPAIADEADDPLGRAKGEALWPAWFPAEELPNVEKAEISSRSWQALYQQRPSAEQGNLFHRVWWRRYNPKLLKLAGLRSDFTAVDSAWKDGVANDFSVAATWGQFQGKAYAMDLWRDQVEYPDLMQALRDVYAKHRAVQVIEDKSSGTSAIQSLRRSTPDAPSVPVIAWQPPTNSSKISRAEAVTRFVEAGLCYLPMEADWVEDFVAEHASFPNGQHDDQVDTTSMALARIFLAGQRLPNRDLNRGEKAAPQPRTLDRLKRVKAERINRAVAQSEAQDLARRMDT
jgi:predicted phage terminase large subunit-like protein